jgi:hypothetical protein
MNLLLAAAMAAALSCPAPQEAPLPGDAPPQQAEAKTEAAAPMPAEPQSERTVCTYETVEGSDVPERVCRTVLQLRLRRLPTAETPTAQEAPETSVTAPSSER